MNLPPAGRAAALLLVVLLFSCTSMMGPRSGLTAALPEETTDIQRLLAEGARRMLGRRHLVARGRTFPYDCTGLVLAIYWYAGIDLARDFAQHSGNGVTRLYRSLEKQNLLYSSSRPAACACRPSARAMRGLSTVCTMSKIWAALEALLLCK